MEVSPYGSNRLCGLKLGSFVIGVASVIVHRMYFHCRRRNIVKIMIQNRTIWKLMLSELWPEMKSLLYSTGSYRSPLLSNYRREFFTATGGFSYIIWIWNVTTLYNHILRTLFANLHTRSISNLIIATSFVSLVMFYDGNHHTMSLLRVRILLYKLRPRPMKWSGNSGVQRGKGIFDTARIGIVFI